MYKRLIYLWMAGCAVFATTMICFAESGEKVEKPNIVFIYADDLGYGDCSVYNPQSKIPTPNIDQLAKEGMRFTDAHSPHATCTGSRYGLLTGTSPARTGINNRVAGLGPTIDKDEVTIADFLKDQGYVTKMVGKWHLGFEKQKADKKDPLMGGPLDCGLDYFYGTEGSALTGNCIKGRHEAEPINLETYNRLLCDDAVRIIREYGASQQDKPLFLYYAVHEPHAPLIPEKEFVGKSQAGVYGDYVVELDHWVGMVVQALKETGLEKNTLLIFASDNGTSNTFANKSSADYNHKSNWIFAGYKASPYEGGHRLPFIVRWPGKIPASTVSKALINHTDFFATLADIFNVDIAKTYPGSAQDSYSFLPVLKDPSVEHKRPAMVVVGSYRKGDWKIIVNGPWGGKTEDYKLTGLYNLADDISEKNNLAESNPEIGKQMFAEYKKFLAARKWKPLAIQIMKKTRGKMKNEEE